MLEEEKKQLIYEKDLESDKAEKIIEKLRNELNAEKK